MKRWWADTLFKRLFILMWAALVTSHVMATGALNLVGPIGAPSGAQLRISTQPMPLMPPTPGLPGGRWLSHREAGVSAGSDAEPFTQFDVPPAFADDIGGAPPPLPTATLALDYGVRLLVIGLFAWAGARWLSRPMRQLVSASHSLTAAIGRHGALPRLDEARGTVEVRETAHVFNDMARELDQQFKSRGLMAAAISHDLRTPLTRVRMRLESIDAEPAQRCIADVREMNELIDSALQVFRDASFAEPMQSTDLQALVQSLGDDLVEQGRRVSVHGDAAVVLAQPVALRRALGNLLTNAVRYGESAEVAVFRESHGVRIVIDDHGPGIPPAQMEAVFQPFYRVEGSRNRHTGGVGLGLYIARELIHRQHGSLALANREGGGLRATVNLPPPAR
ncbi:MAG TPA: ATP-binding protein [Albitalea sp.]|nr:ATP-binding protein [Albitalea sp.]